MVSKKEGSWEEREILQEEGVYVCRHNAHSIISKFKLPYILVMIWYKKTIFQVYFFSYAFNLEDCLKQVAVCIMTECNEEQTQLLKTLTAGMQMSSHIDAHKAMFYASKKNKKNMIFCLFLIKVTFHLCLNIMLR